MTPFMWGIFILDHQGDAVDVIIWESVYDMGCVI